MVWYQSIELVVYYSNHVYMYLAPFLRYDHLLVGQICVCC